MKKKQLRQRSGQKIYELENGQVHVESVNDEPSLTQQQFAKDCDMNHIIDRFSKTGDFIVPIRQGSYVDTTVLPQDHMAAMQKVIQAREAYEALDPKIRSRFKTPQDMLNFVHDVKNKEEAERLGLLKPKEEVPPPAAPPKPAGS